MLHSPLLKLCSERTTTSSHMSMSIVAWSSHDISRKRDSVGLVPRCSCHAVGQRGSLAAGGAEQHNGLVADGARERFVAQLRRRCGGVPLIAKERGHDGLRHRPA